MLFAFDCFDIDADNSSPVEICLWIVKFFIRELCDNPIESVAFFCIVRHKGDLAEADNRAVLCFKITGGVIFDNPVINAYLETDFVVSFHDVDFCARLGRVEINRRAVEGIENRDEKGSVSIGQCYAHKAR